MTDVTKKSQYILEVKRGTMGTLKIIVDPSEGPGPGKRYATKSANKQSSARSVENWIHVDDFASATKEKFWDFYDLGTRLQNLVDSKTWMTGVIPLDTDPSIPTDSELILQYFELLFSQEADIEQTQGDGVPQGHRDVYSMFPENDAGFFNLYLGADHVQITPTDLEEIKSWDSILLGIGKTIDPFGTTSLDHGGARKIPNCMPLKYNGDTDTSSISPPDEFQINLYDPTEDPQDPQYFINAEGRVNMEVSGFIPMGDRWADADDPELERKDWEIWNELSLTQRSRDISHRGRINVGKLEEDETGQELKSGSLQLKMVSRTAYEEFDTGDTTNYKVTTQPSFESDEVAFSTASTTPLKFYLKPQWLGTFTLFGFNNGVSVSYESYRNGPENGWPFYRNGWTPTSSFTVSMGSPNPNASLSVSVSVVENDMAVADGTATIIANTNTGVYNITGLPNGSVSGTATGSNTTGWSVSGVIQNGYELTGGWTGAHQFPDGAYFNGDLTDDMGFVIQWHTINVSTPFIYHLTGLGVSGRGLTGGHISRRPAFPRVMGSTVERVEDVTGNGFSDFDYTYSDSTVKHYSASQAVAYEGTVEHVVEFDGLFGSPSGPLGDTYIRSPDRNPHVLVNKFQHSFMNVSPVTGQVVTVINPAEIPPGTYGTPTEIIDMIQQNLDDYKAVIDGVASLPYVRNFVSNINSNSVGISGPYMYMVQLDAEIGSLCGVIVKGGIKYYIWRKTKRVRSGYDYNRHIFYGQYFGSPV